MSRNRKTMRTARTPKVCFGCRCAINVGDTYRDSNPPPLERPYGLPPRGRIRLCAECAGKHASLQALVDSLAPRREPDLLRMVERKIAEGRDRGFLGDLGEDYGEGEDSP
ncbi:MAG: hypothetical protein KC492_44520 [Myxococcales bacterium]|nr:hypothetical protein [Myxococcales bacterium]